MFKTEILSALLKASTQLIRFEDVQRFLPFQTRIVSGSNFNHIQSRTAFDVKTYGKPFTTLRYGAAYPEYTVSEGETLCRRSGRLTSTRGGHSRLCP